MRTLRTMPLPLPDVFLKPNERTFVHAVPQMPCRLQRVRAYLRPGEDVSRAVAMVGLRVGNQYLPAFGLSGMSLEAMDFSGPLRVTVPVCQAGQELALELTLVSGAFAFERSLSLIAFVEAITEEERCVARETARRHQAELATERQLRADLERDHAQAIAYFEDQLAAENRIRGELELQVIALRTELEGRAAWRRELAERRAAARSRVRAPVVRVLVDLDID